VSLRSSVRRLLRRDESDVLIGNDGWLFLRAGSNNVLDQHTGRRRMPQDDVEAWHAALAGRVEWARDRGVAYRAIFVPDSQAVYRDKLPDDVAAQLIPHDQRPVPVMIASLPREVRDAVLYPLDELIAASARDETFQRGDTHWTEFGSWVVYNALKDSLGDLAIDWISEDRLAFHAASEWGDLGSKLDPPQMTLCLRAELSGADATCTFDNKVRNNGHVRVYRRSEPTSQARCLVFADSFARNIEKFLVNTFAETVLVHSSRRFDFEFAETVAPDVVLTLGVERFAIDPPRDRDGQSVVEVAAAKQAAGTTTGPAVGVWPWP
jgi:alginate O-acetyltransferase complex protein AlgJ